MENHLTKKERRIFRREEKDYQQEAYRKEKEKLKHIKISVFSICMFIAIGLVWWAIQKTPQVLPSEVVSENGLHWHAELSMYVKGKKLDIPKDIGIGRIHEPVHTHDSDGTIHMEFQGRVEKDDLKLSRFFRNWEKDMKSFGRLISMKVNGQENTEFEQYGMEDNDKIELRYE